MGVSEVLLCSLSLLRRYNDKTRRTEKEYVIYYHKFIMWSTVQLDILRSVSYFWLLNQLQWGFFGVTSN